MPICVSSLGTMLNSTKIWYHHHVNSRHRKTLERIMELPTRSDVAWVDIEALFIHLGADLSEGKGSRLRVALHGTRAVFHRPHPQKETDKGALGSVRLFLITAGVII